MAMLEEIRSFFEALRYPFSWRANPSLERPFTDNELRVESERHWRLEMEAVDALENAVLHLYEAGADDPAAIDLLDAVVVIVRRQDEQRELRFREITELLSRASRR
jgi:hypothetical protein